MPRVNREECVGCGMCVKVCPVGAISMQDGVAVIDDDVCVRCGRCLQACPVGAIKPNFESA